MYRPWLNIQTFLYEFLCKKSDFEVYVNISKCLTDCCLYDTVFFYSSLFVWQIISIVSLLITACLLIAIGYSKCFKETKKIYPEVTIVTPQAA